MEVMGTMQELLGEVLWPVLCKRSDYMTIAILAFISLNTLLEKIPSFLPSWGQVVTGPYGTVQCGNAQGLLPQTLAHLCHYCNLWCGESTETAPLGTTRRQGLGPTPLNSEVQSRPDVAGELAQRPLVQRG